MLDTRHKLCTFILKNPPGEFFFFCFFYLYNCCHENFIFINSRSKIICLINFYCLLCCIITINVESDSGSVKKEKEKKNRKKDKENGSGSGDSGNHKDIDAPDAVVGAFLPFYD